MAIFYGMAGCGWLRGVRSQIAFVKDVAIYLFGYDFPAVLPEPEA